MAEERVVSRRRHSAELRALVLEQCAAPRASVAKVAMSYGLNANLVHGWRKVARERGADDARLTPSPSVSGPSPLAPADIQIELRRGTTAMRITWPIAAAADCAAWMRELLR